ncbi:type IV secretion associated ABC transporter permease TagS [Paralimibaculum aggregatum]|uniref:Type IV secretion associated ABC transporter permease TagS n=1 Tax=Paralimibaculum aggregatum TaxID=3036245 RepID=A0ABQ6LTE9_9RHOB|nr:FtsX-like permease family protein [Limibaculum sp. NKW23]GMG85336.1 type IV secretion associated ABC transporter permease TagS [Limibaculum sp. NKW23]
MGLPVWRLATADLLHEWPTALVAVLGVTVALAPLLILFGLWFGVVEAMRSQLAENPATREIRHRAIKALPEGFFEAARARPETGFLIPRTRYVNLQVTLQNRAAADGQPAEVILAPTGAGDPLLGFAGLGVPQGDALVLGARAAEALGAAPGDRLRLVLARRAASGRRERVAVPLTVAGILPAEVEPAKKAYAPLPLLAEIQAYQEWIAVPARGWEGDAPRGDQWGGFRLYARDLDSVEPLRRWLAGQGLDVTSEAERIAFAGRVDRDLGRLFYAILGLTLTGYVLSIGLTQAAAVARKRRIYATLRLIGYRGRAIAAMPVLQGAAIALAGALAALLVYHAIQPAIGALFRDLVAGEGGLMRLPWRHAAAALLGSVAVAALASTVAARRALTISPAETLRDA